MVTNTAPTYNPLNEFSVAEIGRHAAADCDETTCRICAKNYPDLVALAKARAAAVADVSKTNT